MNCDLGYADLPDRLSPRAEAITLLLERSDPDDVKRRHTLKLAGDRRKARRFIRRCQWIYLETRAHAMEPQ